MPSLIINLKVPKGTAASKALQRMASEELYARYNQLNARLNEAQRAAANSVVMWSANTYGRPMADAARGLEVDALQIALCKHMEIAPDDDSDGEEMTGEAKKDRFLMERLRDEYFAQEHLDSTVRIEGYDQPLRHYQTRQYHDQLQARTDLLLDDSKADRRLMVNKNNRVNKHTGGVKKSRSSKKIPANASRARMAAVLEAYGEANPGEHFSVTMTDRDRLLGATDTDAHKGHAEPMLRTDDSDEEKTISGSERDSVLED